jgi:hypothetical protein
VIKRGWFGFDDSAPVKGYTYGDTWNGWAKPWFTWETARTLVESGYINNDPESQTWLLAREKSETIWENQDGESHASPMAIVDTPDGKQRLYRLGDGFCWNDESKRPCGCTREDDTDQCATHNEVDE